MSKRCVCAVAAWSLACVAVFAQESSEQLTEICAGERLPLETPAFELFDADLDQRLTSGEAAVCPALAEVFTRLDLDADETLSRAEYRGFADIWRRRLRTFGDDAR